MKYYSCAELSKMYGVSQATVKGWIRSGKLEAIQYPHMYAPRPGVYTWLIPEWQICRIGRPIKHYIEPTQEIEYDEKLTLEAYIREAIRRVVDMVNTREQHKYYQEYIENAAEMYREYLNTEHYKKKRLLRLKLDDYRCQRCGTGKNLQVHHINYDRLGYPEEIEDMITLCNHCHEYVHEYDIARKRPQESKSML